MNVRAQMSYLPMQFRAHLSRRRFGSARMLARPLRQQENARDDKYGDDGRGDRPAKRQAAIADRLVEEIADGCAKRPGQDKSRPK